MTYSSLSSVVGTNQLDERVIQTLPFRVHFETRNEAIT